MILADDEPTGRRVAVALALFLTACLAVPAAAHVTTGVDDDSDWAPGLWKQLLEIQGSQALFSGSTWYVVGPFPSGEREAGADPLAERVFSERYHSGQRVYPSEMNVTSGLVGWRSVKAGHAGDVKLTYPDAPWSRWSDAFGSAGTLWQGWAVTELAIEQRSRVVFRCIGVRECYWDGPERMFLGDWYSVGAVHAVTLDPGMHRLYLRLHNSFRATQSTSVPFVVSGVKAPVAAVTRLQVVGRAVLPDMLADSVTGPIGVTLMNPTERWARGIRVRDVESAHEAPAPHGLPDIPPGGTVRVALRFQIRWDYYVRHGAQSIDCRAGDATGHHLVNWEITADGMDPLPVLLRVPCRGTWAVASKSGYRFTFVDPDDGSVQQALVRPPSGPVDRRRFPDSHSILLGMHGAGVSLSSAWMDAFLPQEWAWTLLPNGRGVWGFDWEGASRSNALNAAQHLAEHLPGVPLELKHVYSANPGRIVYTGHSMGGHGCMHAMTHGLGRSYGSACVAGFTQIERYVPYNPSVGGSWTSPRLAMVLTSAIAELDNEWYIRGHPPKFPTLLRYGTADTNVPPWHSLRLRRMLIERGVAAELNCEVGQHHWWDMAMKGAHIQNFFNRTVAPWQRHWLPPGYLDYAPLVRTLSPVQHVGSRGFRILQMLHRGEEASLQVSQYHFIQGFHITTHNVRRWAVDRSVPDSNILSASVAFVVIDGQTLSGPFRDWPAAHFLRRSDGTWSICGADDAWQRSEMGPLIHGPLRNVMLHRRMVLHYDESHALAAHAAQTISLMWTSYGNGVARPASIPASRYPDARLESSVMFVTDPAAVRQSVAAGHLVIPGANGTCIVARSDDGACIDADQDYAYLLLGLDTKLAQPVAVLGASSAAGWRAVLQAWPARTGARVPDALVLHVSTFLRAGSAGIISARTYTYDWRIDPSMSYHNDLLVR